MIRLPSITNTVRRAVESGRSPSASADKGKVYFIGAGTSVKIGFTRGRIQRRLSDLQVGSAEKLELLAYAPGTIADEAALHNRFSAFQTTGEWHRREGALLIFISEVAITRRLGAI